MGICPCSQIFVVVAWRYRSFPLKDGIHHGDHFFKNWFRQYGPAPNGPKVNNAPYFHRPETSHKKYEHNITAYYYYRIYYAMMKLFIVLSSSFSFGFKSRDLKCEKTMYDYIRCSDLQEYMEATCSTWRKIKDQQKWQLHVLKNCGLQKSWNLEYVNLPVKEMLRLYWHQKKQVKWKV